MGWELDEYKNRVKAVAIRVANEQSWCKEGLRDTLAELDIEYTSRVEFEVTVKFIVKATCIGEDGGDPMDSSFIEGSVRDATFELDGDWEDVEVTDYEISDICDIQAVD